MIALSFRPVMLAALGASLALSVPAVAQTKSAPTPPPAVGAGSEDHGGWDNETFEHQEFREEMAQIRKEHEEIETARDKLLDKCVNTTGAQIDACNKERQELHDRQAKLHERVHALHEKMRAASAQHPENGNRPGTPDGTASPPTAPNPINK